MTRGGKTNQNSCKNEWMNLTRCHWLSTDKFTGSTKWWKVFTLALWNLSVEIYQLKEENIFDDTKVLWRENPENCVWNPSLQTQMCEESLKAHKLYFGFKDCLTVNTFLIEIKVSSRNWASETFSNFHYFILKCTVKPDLSTFSMLNEN